MMNSTLEGHNRDGEQPGVEYESYALTEKYKDRGVHRRMAALTMNHKTVPAVYMRLGHNNS